jgi:hypothetical protein
MTDVPWMDWYQSLAKPEWTPAPQTIGLIWQALCPVKGAGWAKSADCTPATLSMPATAPNPRARHDLAPAGTGRHARKERGSGRSRTDDGGFAIRCLSHLATEP